MLLRFRPIMMTTSQPCWRAAARSQHGTGSELAPSACIAIVVDSLSQFLTLYTTPVIYLYLDGSAGWCRIGWHGNAAMSLPEDQRGAGPMKSQNPFNSVRPVARRCWLPACFYLALWPISSCLSRQCRA